MGSDNPVLEAVLFLLGLWLVAVAVAVVVKAVLCVFRMIRHARHSGH
jgi:hypothetical protein